MYAQVILAHPVDEVKLCLHDATLERERVGRALSELRIRDDEVMRVSIFENALAIVVLCPVSKASIASVACLQYAKKVKTLLLGEDDDLHEAVFATLHLSIESQKSSETTTPTPFLVLAVPL
ncbi:hypothetical protein Y032_0017g3306 [Ancylostoma ceylanicum]|uniref:Uncharacterized protein n=1 Tax=Ancylostoma ceylanicum TaxID=53326 RepID=A0A016V4H3_9BILA|nr:hypothetical protein Y032_0017g3306 [Ancylostoma ceylanicum]